MVYSFSKLIFREGDLNTRYVQIQHTQILGQLEIIT